MPRFYAATPLCMSAALLFIAVIAVAPVHAQEGTYAGPIIDMHLHGYADAAFPENPPPNMRTGQTSVGTAREHMERTVEFMRRYNVVLGAICSIPAEGQEVMEAWAAYAPDMVLRGIAPDDPTEFMDPPSYRELAQAGGVDVACEVGGQYVGFSPSDTAYGPYWAIAEELGIPVAVHTGPAAPGAGPGFRVSLGNPLLLEDVLAEYPQLKVYLMHAGVDGPFMDYALYMMASYPQVYADIGMLTWLAGEEMLGELLRKAKQWRVLDRVMFGTDQMFWPEAIGMAVERVNGYDFLSVEEKAGIFYGNAARFLELSEEEIARHHGR